MSEQTFTIQNIRAIIGLGNPGPRFIKTRHNAGFIVLDHLANKENASWKEVNKCQLSEIFINGKKTLLIKPLTFMNNSGEIIHILTKKGIKPEEILVIHDELEKPFGSLTFKFSGSAKGHNGLRSIMHYIPSTFWRLRFGIGRPETPEEVGNYVLSNFTPHEEERIPQLIENILAHYF